LLTRAREELSKLPISSGKLDGEKSGEVLTDADEGPVERRSMPDVPRKA